MSGGRPSDRLLEDWGRLSARSRPRAAIRRQVVQSRRPASVSFGLLATVAAVAVVGIALINRATGPAATTPQPSSPGPSAIAAGPSASSTPVPSPVPTSTPTRRPGRDVHEGALITALDGWAMLNDGAGNLLMTHDGGASWAATTQPAPGERIVGVAFADAQHGWVIGDTYPAEGASGTLVVNVHRTDDGGATWQTIELASIPSPGPDPTIAFPTVSVLSADRVFVMLALPDAPGSVSRLYATSDGGRSWDRRAGVTESQRFAFLDETHGWAIRGDTGVLVRTVDGGRSWERAPTPILFGYQATIPVRAPDGRLVMSLESNKDGEPERFATSDDLGATWVAGHTAPAGAGGSISVLEDGTWFLGGQMPMRSRDDGATWESVTAGPPDAIGDVTVAGGSHLSTLVARPDCPPNADCYVPRELWISDDAGMTWRNVTP